MLSDWSAPLTILGIYLCPPRSHTNMSQFRMAVTMHTTKSLLRVYYFHRNFKTFKTQFLPLKNMASPPCTVLNLFLDPFCILQPGRVVSTFRYLCFITIRDEPRCKHFRGHWLKDRLVMTFWSAVISTKLDCLFPLQRNFTTCQVYYFLEVCLVLCFTRIDIATFIFWRPKQTRHIEMHQSQAITMIFQYCSLM